jgi:hypothetical protein
MVADHGATKVVEQLLRQSVHNGSQIFRKLDHTNKLNLVRTLHVMSTMSGRDHKSRESRSSESTFRLQIPRSAANHDYRLPVKRESFTKDLTSTTDLLAFRKTVVMADTDD